MTSPANPPKVRGRWLFQALVLAALTPLTFSALASPAWSNLNIILQEAPAGSTLTPAYDANLDELGDIMAAAASYWEGIILDNHNVTVTYGYVDLPPAQHGLAQVTAHDGVRATAGNVAFDIESNTPGDWFFDPTPNDHSEFSSGSSRTIWSLERTTGVFTNLYEFDFMNDGGAPLGGIAMPEWSRLALTGWAEPTRSTIWSFDTGTFDTRHDPSVSMLESERSFNPENFGE